MFFLKKNENDEFVSKKDLQRGIKKQEFVFYYQPEFDLKTGDIVALEALVRWDSPKGIVPPNLFIPVLEESGLIHKFTDFLFNQTLLDLKQIHEAGYASVKMAVNLTVSQLLNPTLIFSIRKALESTLLKSKNLEIEVTESHKLEFPLQKDVFKELNDMGISVAIDDFGTGYSSFGYLKNIDIQKIKIDCDFVRTLEDNPKNKIIISSIIKLAHDLNIPVLAEGIETTDQKKWLEKNGCDYGQGFWFSRPIPMEQLVTFFKKNKK